MSERAETPTIRPIRTETEYLAAVAQIEGLMVPFRELGRDEEDRLAVLAELASGYEERHLAREELPLSEALRIRLEKTGRTVADLGADLESDALARGLLTGGAEVSVRTARILRDRYRIPFDLSLSEKTAVPT